MRRVTFLVLLALLAGACADVIQTQVPPPGAFNLYFRSQNVKPGMSRAEVEAVMGPPQIREQGDFRQGRYLLYFYRTHSMDYDGSNTVRGGYTPLVFQNDVLLGMGKREYLRAVDRSWTEQIAPAPWQRSW
ncbi:MAG: DUF3192 domain-containing protein [Deltaproteobacteria bacterium]|nr:DUF3192 domain-containing protein [Deltaproteobacteria bacterium]